MLLCFIIIGAALSDQNTQFGFVPEEKPFIGSHHENKTFFFCLKAICLCVVCVGIGSWFVSNQSSENVKSGRTIQSLQDPSASIQKVVYMNSFLVFLKSEKGFQLTKMEVILQVNHSQVLDEIQKSSNKVKDHLIFILSYKNTSVFTNLQERQSLEQEIITQLNLFLVAGRIENIQLTETFLN